MPIKSDTIATVNTLAAAIVGDLTAARDSLQANGHLPTCKDAITKIDSAIANLRSIAASMVDAQSAPPAPSAPSSSTKSSDKSPAPPPPAKDD